MQRLATTLGLGLSALSPKSSLALRTIAILITAPDSWDEFGSGLLRLVGR
jgi:hypothetical protein